MKKTKVLGISGYMSSGKSLAGRFFKEKGFFLIDADEVVDELYVVGEAGWKKIRDYFGPEYLKKDGTVNRAKLGRFVFGDSRKLKILNNLIHPLVNDAIRRKLDACKSGLAAVEAAYFREKHLLDLVDAILWIECDRDVLLKRAKVNGVDEKMFSMVVAVQEKPERIDYVIENDASMSRFESELERVYQKFVFGV